MGGSKAVLTIIKKQTFPYRIASLSCHVHFNLRSGEFNTRGSSPALDEICLLHFCGSLLSIRDVLLKWAKYLFWYWVTPQAPALQLSTIAMVAIIKDSRLLCCVRRGKSCCSDFNKMGTMGNSGGQPRVVERKDQGSCNEHISTVVLNSGLGPEQ